MPYKSDHVEYSIESGHITIAMETGGQLPAYWAHPARGTKFPAVGLIHNWWGITPIVRRMAHLFAQTGYYVVIPDLFNGALPKTHAEAKAEVQKLGSGAFVRIDAALNVLENHHMCNRKVAAVGIGMGGSLAYQAAVERDDLEVAVSFYGFPQKMLGQFHRANTPILGVYGTQDAIIKPVVVERLRQEFGQSPLRDKHRVVTVEGAGHDFIADSPNEAQRAQVGQAWGAAVSFIETYIEPPPKKNAKVY